MALLTAECSSAVSKLCAKSPAANEHGRVVDPPGKRRFPFRFDHADLVRYAMKQGLAESTAVAMETTLFEKAL